MRLPAGTSVGFGCVPVVDILSLSGVDVGARLLDPVDFLRYITSPGIEQV